LKAYLELELRGDDMAQWTKLWKSIANDMTPGFGNIIFGNMPKSAWVAEIAGTHQKYKYDRRFLRYNKDYSRSNSKGSRGVFAMYILESGHLYDVKDHKNRYFCTVDNDGNIIKIPQSEVDQWLKDHLELTC